MRLLRRTFSFVLALLMVLGLSTTAFAAQGYESIDLTAGAGVTGNAEFPTTATFSVNMGENLKGGLTIYRIADAKYDVNSGTVVATWTTAPGDPTANPSDNVNWVAELVNTGWLLEGYASPAELGAAPAATQKSLLTSVALYLDVDNENYPYGDGHKNSVQSAITVSEPNDVFDYEPLVYTEESSDNGVYTFTGLPIGIYLAFDEEDHTPYTINAVPQKMDDGTWAIPNNQFRRKFSGASLVKTIDKDQVSVGDTVNFTITAGVPTYSENMDEGKKIFTIDDDMSTAFAYNKGTMKVYWISEGSNDKVEVSQMNSQAQAVYTPVISSDVTVYSCPTSSHQYFNIYEVIENNVYYYYFMKDDVLNLLYSTSSKASNTLSYSGPVFKAYQKLTGDTISHGLSPLNMDKNLFNVNFNYSALEQWKSDNQITGNGKIVIEYSATVTESAQVNSEANANTAVLRYAKDEDGTVERLDDTVRAYTYGVNIVKVNGDTVVNGVTNERTEYLAGASFSLYKLAERTDNTDAAEGTENIYKVTDFDELGNATAGDDMDAYNAKLKEIMDQNQVPYSLPNVVADDENAGSTKVDGYFLYGKIKSGIQSVASAAGVQVNGLGPGTYLLIEDLAPSGFNLLTQGIRFTIKETALGTTDNGMGDGQVSEVTGKRANLTGFVDGQNAYHASGYMDMLVSNYKGLTLPETGGEGTVLFTMAGITLMAGAMFILLLKKRRMA